MKKRAIFEEKRVFVLGILVMQIAMFISLSCSAGVIKEVPEDLLPAAEKILIKKFKSNTMQVKGFLPYFQPEDNLMDFRLGEPYPKYALDGLKIYRLKDNTEFLEALEFLRWRLPIYLGDEKEPRTILSVKKNGEENWVYTGMGGYAQNMLEAKKLWPAEKGYSHAMILVSGLKVPLIMLEKDSKLQFYYFRSNNWAERLFGIYRNSDGYYPLFSKDHLIEKIKGNKERFEEREGLRF